MLVIYSPEGGDRQEFEFDPDEAWHFDAELIESVGRPTWVSFDTDFLDLLRAGNFKARRALLWVMLRRENPTLRFPDLAVKVKEISLGLDKAERRNMRERIKAGEFTAAEQAAVEEMLADYPDEESEVEPVGKDVPGDSVTDSP